MNILPVAILSGGLATRMRPITQTIPKVLLPVAGRPFIAWQLEHLQKSGVRDVVLCVGYLGEQVQEVVADGAAFGLSVRYSFDGNTLLGTGGALRQALPLLGEHFFVLYGDAFLRCSYADVQATYVTSQAPALMTVLHNRSRWDESNVFFQNGTIQLYNKWHPTHEMEHIDYGLSVLSATALKTYPKQQFLDVANVFHELSVQGRLAGFEAYERFYEVGSPNGFKEAERFFLRKGDY